jgi:hypothetical protein
MMTKFLQATTLFVAAAAEADEAVSMLQLQAKKQSSTTGLCGMDVLKGASNKPDATFQNVFDEFAFECKKKYEAKLCEDLEAELFDGVNAADSVAANPEVTKQVCQELNALMSADSEHDDVVGADSALLERSQDTSAQGDMILDQALSSKGTPRRRRHPPPPPPCNRGHCSHHGNTWDNNANDGCSCSCDAGWGGSNCAADIRCNAQSCNSHGSTSDMNSLDGCVCSCFAGWGGSDCGNDITCKAADCSNHGSTTDKNRGDGCVCSCQEGWGGANCGTDITCSNVDDCSGHGETSDKNNGDGCTCACNEGWGGDGCGTDISCSAEDDCSSHGTTEDMNELDGCNCLCDKFWKGDNCAEEMSREEKKEVKVALKAAKAQKKAAKEAKKDAKAAKAAKKAAKAARR